MEMDITHRWSVAHQSLAKGENSAMTCLNTKYPSMTRWLLRTDALERETIALLWYQPGTRP